MKLFIRNFIISIFILLGVFILPSSANATELQLGSVWEWATATVSATQKQGLTDIVSVSAGSNHSLALKKDGTVWAWGSNNYGQLGIGTVGGSSIEPVQVKSPDGLGYLTDIKAIAAGGNWFSMVLKNDGTVWVWGYNGYGSRGTGIGTSTIDGGSSKLLFPTQVKSSSSGGFLSQVIAIVAGDNHSLVLKSNGDIFAWGSNAQGQTGTGSSIYSSTVYYPTRIASNAISVAAGGMHSLVVKVDGTVWGVGRFSSGQLGDFSNGWQSEQYSLVQISAINDIKSVWSKSVWNVALSTDGKIFEWGHRFSPDDRNPRQVPGLENVIIAATGNGVGLVTKGDGTAWQWNADKNDIPKQISSLSNISSITVGVYPSNLAVVKMPDSTPTPTPTPKTPLILIPGIGGSEFKSSQTFLSKVRGCGISPVTFNYNVDDLVWLDGIRAGVSPCDEYLDVLKLKIDGLTPEYPQIVLSGNLFEGAYGGLINFFTNNGYELGNTLFIFPYDWRKDISLTLTPLGNLINAIKTQTGSQKVDIIAHSMGGLVARNYIADTTRAQNIRKLFTLGAPHLGAVDSLKNLRFGGCLTKSNLLTDIVNNIICLGVAPNEVKDIIQNMISGYELAPSQSYFNFYSGEDNSHPYPYKTESGILNYTQIKNLLTGLSFNTSLFNPSETFHILDNSLSNLNDVDITVIAGSGQPTLGQIIEEKTISLLGIPYIHKDIANINGDGTVPLFSASLNDPSKNLSLLGLAKAYYTNQNHGELAASGSALNLVKNILEGNSPSIEGVSTQPYSLPNGWLFSKHSPVDMNIYDSGNNHTGPTDNGNFETNIPGSSYTTLDDAAFIFIPNGGNYKIEFEATDQGSFDFKIRKYENDTVSKETLYKDIPLTTSTKAEAQFDTTSNISPIIHLDEEGNGIIQDVSPTSNLSGNAVFDQASPQTNIQLSGILGNNGWYKSDVTVALDPQDEASGSGILKTEYSLDNGQTVNIYTEPFTISTEKINKLKFRSIDNAGNEEDPQEIEIKIDKTPPEAKISVDSDKQDLVVAGKDTNVTTVIRSDNKLTKKKDDAFYIITDLAGNSLKIDVRERDKNKQDRFRIYSIQYNNDPIKILANNHFNVIYNGKRQRSNIKEQNFELKGEVKIRIQYDAKKNKSTIIVKENKKEKVKEIKNGLAYLNLLTDKGQLRTNY